MIGNRKNSGRAASMPAGLLYGLAVSLGVTILGTGIIAKTLDMEKMREGMTGYAVMILLFAASYTGALVSRNKIKRQHLAVCGLSALQYFLMLLSITTLFFGGQYEAVGVTGLLVLGGSMLALITGRGRRRGGGRRKRMRANC